MSIFNNMFGRSKKLDELERSVNDLKEVCLTEISEINEKIEDLRKTIVEVCLQVGRITSRLSAADFDALVSVAREALQQKSAKEWAEAKKDMSDWCKTQRPLCEQEKDALMLRLLQLVHHDTAREWKDDVEKICNDLRAKYGIPAKSVETETKPTEDKTGSAAEEKKDKPVRRTKRQFKKTVKKSVKKDAKKEKPEDKAVTETAFVTAMNAGPNEGIGG